MANPILGKGKLQGFLINALITIGIIMITRRITILRQIVYGKEGG